jgi:hypothetical protein
MTFRRVVSFGLTLAFATVTVPTASSAQQPAQGQPAQTKPAPKPAPKPAVKPAQPKPAVKPAQPQKPPPKPGQPGIYPTPNGGRPPGGGNGAKPPPKPGQPGIYPPPNSGRPPGNGGGYVPPPRPPPGHGGWYPPKPPYPGYHYPTRPPGGYPPPRYPPYNGWRPIYPPPPPPIYRPGAWYWNNGAVWRPYPTYWAGGFWGAFAIGTAAAIIIGAITQPQYATYQVQGGSPGAQLLNSYQLMQVPCRPYVVVIHGPNDTIVCAEPNGLVAPGDYSVDPSTLTLVNYQQY